MAVVLCTCILIGIGIGICSGEIFTPPPPGEKPVISNGIVYNLRHIPVECQQPHVLGAREIRYGMVLPANQKRAIMKIHSPYQVHGNIEIPPSTCLYIEPGVTLYFGPGYGMIVNGTLIGRGSEEKGGRITMTKDPENVNLVGASKPFPTDARLVDGNTTRDGKLELFYNGRWRGVCTNYVNFTKIDANVTCRHLGFVWGNFTYHSFSRNKTEYMLFEKPNCKGHENSLFNCTGGTARGIKVGHHICDGQQLVGFECAGLHPDMAKDYWRGLEMYNVTVKAEKLGNLYYNETLSWLEYLDISYAGKDIYRGDGHSHGRASISASPYVPLMNNITVSHGAYDGLNMTDIIGPIHIANSTIANNRGYGVYIETGIGRVLINMTDIEDNWGDGVKMYMKNYTIYDWELKFPSSNSFCRAAVPSELNYPFFVYENIIDTDGNKPYDSYDCSRTFNTVPGHRVSVHFLLMERDPTVTARMKVYDQDKRGRLMGDFPVTNGSFPQSITSDSNKIMIQMTYTLPPKPPSNSQYRCKTFRPCLRFLLQFWSDEGPDEELRFINSSASNNTGYGLNVQDMRSKVAVNSSVVSGNKYGAGIRIYQGAGEIAINNTLIESNARSGINISYAGGYQLVNNSKILSTDGYGMITEYLRLNNSRFEHFLKMEIARSVFSLNEWIAIRVGNYCRGGEILINTTDFYFNNNEAVEYLSCNVSTEAYPPTNITLAFNNFRANKRHGILMSPIINTVGLITNNTFSKHSLGAVRIDNTYDLLVSKWYSKFKVDYKIYENTFTENDGRYAIDMRLTQNSPYQKMEFKFNRVIYNNISDISPYLNPRNRANAPIIVSSNNIFIQRNYIHNPDSVRDIATHLVDPSVTIQGNYNWWGALTDGKVHEFVHSRIFDKDDRYNLANIEYFPVLREQWLYTGQTTFDVPKYRWVFHRGNKIGGILDVPGFTAQPNMRYQVDKDIFIKPGATLELRPNTVLEFENSIGLVAHGRLKADGIQSSSPVLFTLKVDPDEVAIENRTASVRLVDGKDEYEGRLEVEMFNTWGAVCNKGWIVENSAVVCLQLGLTYDPAHGVAETQIRSGSTIVMSRVKCNHLDTDLTQCESEKFGEFSCDFTNIVYLRCQPPTWAGVTLPAVPKGSMAEPTQIRHVIIEHAGLMDADEMKYTPGLTIDYNYLKITGLIVRKSVSDGVNVKYSHPHTENLFEHCMFDNNQGNGFLTRSPFLKINYATMNNNDKSGFVYDPYFTEYEALSVRNFIEPSLTVDLVQRPYYKLGQDSMMFIVTKPGLMTVDFTYMMEIEVDNYYRITLQLLDYNPLTNVEKVTIYDSNKVGISTNTKRWEIEKDMVDFPLISTSYYMTIAVLVRGVFSGRLAFAAISKRYPFEPPFSQINFYNCTIQHNKQGILTKHYNNPSNEKLEIFHRIKEEEIRFEMVNVFDNTEEAMYIPSLTKYHDQLIPTPEEMTRPERLGVIKYKMVRCKFYRNGKGILADHNHVDFANNVWQWTFNDSEIRYNKYGGFDIELPRVNDIVERKYHSVFVKDCVMQNNQQMVFNVNGYYANVTIMSSKFVDNTCLRGLMYIGGMEKDLTVYNNIFQRNIGKYVIELDMTSHSEYFDLGAGKFHVNSISDNRPSLSYSCVSASTPTTYAVAIRGVLDITFNRNIFQNPLLQFELIAGIYSLLVNNRLNVKENWWGTPVQYAIRQKIFDFDDWNSYVIADYFPQLTVADIINDNAISTGSQDEFQLDLQKLGGRIDGFVSLPKSSIPYKVVSDLTIMPNAKLIIPPGSVLHFNPNVGILVLGQLVARGSMYSRIKFAPAIQSRFGNSCIKKRSTQDIDVHATTSGDVRLRRDKNGIIPNHQGFLELHNSTTDTWTIMCDSKFNKKTAEVVCRELGLETVNVDIRFTHLFDHYIFGKPMYFRKEFWTYSYYCNGDEPSLGHCMKRINYDIQKCIHASNYTFIRCGERTLDSTMDYWGNIRFASKTYEENIVPVVPDEQRSVLEYVDIDGAGMLHGEKVGAIQATYVTPIMQNINVTRCLWNGFDIVSPRYELQVHNINISRNLGYGINVLMLNGESSDDEKSSFIPLIINTVPYFMMGLVDICRMEKEIFLENRVIVYYKYSQYERSCVKVIEGNNKLRKVSFRLLQFNLYQDDFYRNVIEVFDGKDVSTNTLITELTSNSTNDDITRRYLATGHTISIHIHASSAHEHYGFIAEIVTSPLSYSNYPDSSTSHKFENIVMRNNEDGAILYQNIGEINPSIYFDRCWIEGNGLAILNLTSPPVIDFNIQNTLILNFQHSLVSKNKGGMYIHANAQSFSTHLQANITNNVFSYGTNGEALNISGHHFQQFHFYENHIFNYSVGDYRDVIHLQNVGTNFTFNIIEKNVGYYILRIFNKEDTDALQRFYANAFWQNNVTALRRATIKVGSGHPLINVNYLVNPESDFELETNPIVEFISGVSIQSKPVDATENWWGSERSNFVLGRIWDNRDNRSLISVNYLPIQVTNMSMIDGKCEPGWRLNDQRCYRYMGAALPYYDAIAFCKASGGYLADSKDKMNFLRYLLRLTENVYDGTLKVWVYAEVAKGYCSAFQDSYIIAEQECHRKLLPFVCERDPYIVPPGSDILALAIGISAGVFGTCLIIVIILLILWYVKSKRRKDERFERAASIRSSYSKSSLHNSRMTLGTRSQLSILTENAHRKRRGYDSRSASDKYSSSMTSSKHKIYDSDDSVTLAGIGVDERRNDMHKNINRSREYLEDLIDSRDKMRNGHTVKGSRDRLDIHNGVSRSRERLDDRYGSKDSLGRSPRLGGPTRTGLGDRRQPNKMQNPRLTELADKQKDYYKKPNDSPGSSLDRKLIKPDDYHDTMTDDTFDGYSTNEFDDITTENEGDADTVKFHPTKFSQINNEINCLQKLPSMDNIYANDDTPSVNRAKSLSSFLQPESPQGNPPTPPPPLEDSPFRSSPNLTPQKPRPVPRPRSTRNSNVSSVGDYVDKLKDNKPVSAPLHLSRENLNFASKKPDWLADKLRETSASEDSDDESINDSSFESGHNNQGYIGSHEDLTKQYNKKLNIPLPQNDLSKPTNSNPPSIASDYSNQLQGSSNRLADLQNMDYMKDSYPSIDYDSPHSRSRENLASPRYPYSGSKENIANPSNRLNRSRENIADQSYPYSGSRENITTPTNRSRSRENIADQGYLYSGSRENIATPTNRSRSRENIADQGYPYSGSRENIATPTNRSRSRENIADQGYPYSGSRENITTPANCSRSRENIADQGYPYYGSRENITTPANRSRSRENIADQGYPYSGSRENITTPANRSRSRENIADPHRSREDVSGYHGSRENLDRYYDNRGPPSYHASRENLQDSRGSRDNLHRGSRENIHGGALQLQNPNKHQSIETEI